MSLTCAASKKFSPPYFTNGIPWRVSSTSSWVTMMASAEQYRLSLQVDACLAVFQDKFDNVLDLRRFIGRYDKLRALARWFA
jgi:hypothetical protein